MLRREKTARMPPLSRICPPRHHSNELSTVQIVRGGGRFIRMGGKIGETTRQEELEPELSIVTEPHIWRLRQPGSLPE